MMTIIIPDDQPPALAGTPEEERLRKLGEVYIFDSRPVSDEELLTRIADADIVINIRATSRFTPSVLNGCSRLKLISIFGVGYDNVDVQTASKLGITITNTPGFSTVSVAEMTLALMLAVARKIPQNHADILRGGWAREYACQLCGKTLGVVGTGAIGQRMVQLGKAIGMQVIAWTFHPSPERAAEYDVNFVTLDELLRRSDVVSIHVSGSPQSDKLIGRRELSLMKPTAILINTARGSVVDQQELTYTLQNGLIAGAGLDVYASEPLELEHSLRHLEKVVLSPHVAAMTPEATLSGLAMAVDNVVNFLEGHPTNAVIPSGLKGVNEG